MVKMFRLKKKAAVMIAVALASANVVMAQGAAGIDAASSELTTYIDPIGNLMMVIGGVVGLIGAVRCYFKWNAGDSDVMKSVMGWMGSCVFLVVSGIIVKAFFGL